MSQCQVDTKGYHHAQHTYLHLTILTSVAIIGNDHGDTTRTGPTQRGDHEQKLHNIVIDRRTRGLHNVHILAADIFVNHHVDFPIGKASHGSLA